MQESGRAWVGLVSASLCLSTGVVAQKIEVPDALTAGEVVEVGFDDPARAGQTVTVTVDNGSKLDPRQQEIEIVLDDTGKGAAAWEVPDWFAANFNAPGCYEVARVISLPPPPSDQ